jgi:hypothetical protein
MRSVANRTILLEQFRPVLRFKMGCEDENRENRRHQRFYGNPGYVIFHIKNEK